MTDTATATNLGTPGLLTGYWNGYYLRVIAGLTRSQRVVKVVHYEWCEDYTGCEQTHAHREFFSAEGVLTQVNLDPETDVLTLVVRESSGHEKILHVEQARRFDQWNNRCGFRCNGQEGWVDVIIDVAFFR